MGNVEKLKEEIEQNKTSVETVDRRNSTALHLAASAASILMPEERLKVVKWLVKEAKAKVDPRDMHDCTPFIWAARYDQTEVMNFLLENKADINAKDKARCSAMIWACKEGKWNAIKFLIKAKADQSPDKYGNTPFLSLIHSGKDIVLLEFLRRFKVNLLATDVHGRNCLHLALFQENRESLVKILLEKPEVAILVHSGDEHGQTPYQFAVEIGGGVHLANKLFGKVPLQQRQKTQQKQFRQPQVYSPNGTQSHEEYDADLEYWNSYYNSLQANIRESKQGGDNYAPAYHAPQNFGYQQAMAGYPVQGQQQILYTYVPTPQTQAVQEQMPRYIFVPIFPYAQQQSSQGNSTQYGYSAPLMTSGLPSGVRVPRMAMNPGVAMTGGYMMTGTTAPVVSANPVGLTTPAVQAPVANQQPLQPYYAQNNPFAAPFYAAQPMPAAMSQAQQYGQQQPSQHQPHYSPQDVRFVQHQQSQQQPQTGPIPQ